MNLIQAVQTGRPFRRPSDAEVYGNDFWVSMDGEPVVFDKDDILSNDWEVQPEPAKEVPPVDRTKRVLTDGSPETSDHREIDPATGMQKGYIVLTEEERKKGFVRPVRRTYVHRTCNVATTMGTALAETWARDISFYGATFCVGCKIHLPVEEFYWSGTNETLGS